MGRVDDSLKPGLTPIPLVTPEGNYDRSLFGPAPFVYDNEGNWEFYEFSPGVSTGVFALLFMNGCPIVMDTTAIYPPLGLAPEYYPKEVTALYLDASQAAALVTTTQTILLPKEQIDGYTATAGVPIKGYLSLTIPQIRAGYEAEQPTLQMIAFSNSGVMSGPLFTQQIGALGLDIGIPVIMRQQDYTQQMRDDGDILVVTVGPITQRYQIVGLFEETSLLPPV